MTVARQREDDQRGRIRRLSAVRDSPKTDPDVRERLRLLVDALEDTPFTEDDFQQARQQPALEAVVRAWTSPGTHPGWYANGVAQMRGAMPLLADALDRLAEQHPEWTDPRWRPRDH